MKGDRIMTHKLYNKDIKICRECGTEIIEEHNSPLYECERCIGWHEE